MDDQPNVVEGLRGGVAWSSLGFDEVYGAFNAIEAKAVLNRTAVDVMLCDIEMPVENGLELFMWVCKMDMDVRTIFLTSHAEFKYAQKALKLGVFDYIVQPAPYSEVFEAVKRAVNDVIASRKISNTLELGNMFRRQEQVICANALISLLRGSLNAENHIQLEKFGFAPKSDDDVFLTLIHIRYDESAEQWEPSLLEFALANVVKEILMPYNTDPFLALFEKRIFAVVVPASQLTAEIVERQLYFLSSVCNKYFACIFTAYLDGPIPMHSLQSSWNKLQERHQENVTLAQGIFRLCENTHAPYVYRVPEIKQWVSLVRDGHPNALEESAEALLNKMIAEGKMNSETLIAFHMDFLEMLHSGLNDKGYIVKIFDTPEKMKIYSNGMKSVIDMKQMIHTVTAGLAASTEPIDHKGLVDQISRYINEHLDSELKRNDIAAQVHLSPDYMTRIFKKETGDTIKDYIIRQKMSAAKDLLRTTNLPVSYIAAKVGYYNFSHFSHMYKKEMGITPYEERHGE